MHHFKYHQGILQAEAVPVPRIAEAVGTPFYLYSLATLEHHYQAFDQAFGRVPHLTCFALKANPNLAVLRIFARMGAGADIVSGGELYRALKAGIAPERIVYSGVGKKTEEIEFALKKKIFMLNVESPEEMRLIDQVAGRLKKKAPVAIRVNPDIDAKTHPYISTGLKKNKFGINIRESLEEYRLARDLPHVQIKGVDCHIGSQLLLTGPFLEAVEKLKKLVTALEALGLTISVLDLGGGLGITYHEEEPPRPREYARAIIQALGRESRTIILEPGRVLVGNAGILVTKVLYVKRGEEKNFIIVDAGMNDLLRPSLYGSFHGLLPVAKKKAPAIQADVVGPICESGDFLAKDRTLPLPQAGDLLAVMSAGAYGFSMSSNYNARPRAAEVLSRGREFDIIRKRETYADLVALERIPAFLRGKPKERNL
ncbi:MAG: diaminopimelate decarboxylase [Desulfobacterota bacterium]|jgi:diaminopimelate decarboxylase|nr:diaminopimelate decarboxylase [Thermodesulfobacteriota bacterium]